MFSMCGTENLMVMETRVLCRPQLFWETSDLGPNFGHAAWGLG